MDDTIPDFLLVRNRVPLTDEQAARLEQWRQHRPTTVAPGALSVLQADLRRARSLARIARLKAKQSGALAAMPASGREALKKILEG